MLVNARLYQDELNNLIKSIEFDFKYQYYFSSRRRNHEFSLDDEDSLYFVSINSETKELLGYISFTIDKEIDCAYQFGIMAFKFNSKIFITDVLKLVNDLFMVYNLNKLEWNCYEDNPAIRSYDKFCKLTNGHRCGKYLESNKLMDGKLHNSIMFELMRKDYLKSELYKRYN